MKGATARIGFRAQCCKVLRLVVCLALLLNGLIQAAAAHGHAPPSESLAAVHQSMIVAADEHGQPCPDLGGHERHPGCLAAPGCLAPAPLAEAAPTLSPSSKTGLLPHNAALLTGRGVLPPFHPPKPIART